MLCSDGASHSATKGNEMDKRIVAMSMSRSDAVRIIDGLSDTIINHLIKCILRPRSSHIPAWKKELRAWYVKIDEMTLKPNGRKINVQILTDCNIGGVCPETLMTKFLQRDDLEDWLPAEVTHLSDYQTLAKKILPAFHRITSEMALLVTTDSGELVRKVAVALNRLIPDPEL